MQSALQATEARILAMLDLYLDDNVTLLFCDIAMINDVYNKRILELAANIPHLQRLADAQARSTAHSKLCGSIVSVDLKMDGDVVSDFGHEVKACALGQASSSIMARHVIGSTAQELRDVRDQLRAMLKENGPAPSGKWHDLEVLIPVRDYKARHASTLLTFDAVVDAIGQIEAKRRAEHHSRAYVG
jgi:NifU-like protein involved in Fe-S cluster formation